MKTRTLFVILTAFALTVSACGASAPSANPQSPTKGSDSQPTALSTIAPTITPTSAPTNAPTIAPTIAPTATPSSATQATIQISGFTFSPATLTIKAGTTVTWTNQDSVEHMVEADDDLFVSDALGNGSSFSFTFDTPGTFTYHCGIHASMKGTIIVTP